MVQWVDHKQTLSPLFTCGGFIWSLRDACNTRESTLGVFVHVRHQILDVWKLKAEFRIMVEVINPDCPIVSTQMHLTRHVFDSSIADYVPGYDRIATSWGNFRTLKKTEFEGNKGWIRIRVILKDVTSV